MSESCSRPQAQKCDRRDLLVGAGATALVGAAASWAWSARKPVASVFVAANQRYDRDLRVTIREGLLASGLEPAWLAGKKVLLKPNLVEPHRSAPHMTTNPAVIAAACGVFREWGAWVSIGEGPGHVRDTDLAVIEAGVDGVLKEERAPFVDLNLDETRAVANVGKASRLGQLHLPRAVLEADLLVTMPKLKTHHWQGMTAAMKNLYGILPGIVYGWPKNVLHHAGIPQTVFDVNASAPKTIAIVDAIDCMEGDGPILGTLKKMGLIIIGANPTAVDATCARIMGLEPSRLGYLQLAGDRLGPLQEEMIAQRGEPWRNVHSPFQILDVPYLQNLRMTPGSPILSS